MPVSQKAATPKGAFVGSGKVGFFEQGQREFSVHERRGCYLLKARDEGLD